MKWNHENKRWKYLSANLITKTSETLRIEYVEMNICTYHWSNRAALKRDNNYQLTVQYEIAQWDRLVLDEFWAQSAVSWTRGKRDDTQMGPSYPPHQLLWHGGERTGVGARRRHQGPFNWGTPNETATLPTSPLIFFALAASM